MNGLINQAMAVEEIPQQSAPEQVVDQESPQANNGNKKEAYKIISSQMVNLLYKSADSIVDSVRASGPKEMADTLARIMIMAVNSIKLAGKKVDPDVMLMSMIQLTKALAEILTEAGVIDKDPRLIEESFFAAVSLADDKLQKEAITPEESQEYAAIMQAIRQMQQASLKQGGAQEQVQPQEVQNGGDV